MPSDRLVHFVFCSQLRSAEQMRVVRSVVSVPIMSVMLIVCASTASVVATAASTTEPYRVLADSAGPFASTPFGTFTGLTTNRGYEWRGIKYSPKPVRFAPSVLPPHNQSAQFDATAFGKVCTQFYALQSESSEDCLFLNVWTPTWSRPSPSSPATTSLPVMVFIHGGSYYVGSGSTYLGYELAAIDGGAVVVTLNYRLGTLGFLALRGVSQSGTQPLNYGLIDQQTAIRWVKQAISSFGGDPNNILIFGESAGGGSVLYHLVMPDSRALYQKAILESAAPPEAPDRQTALGMGDFAALQVGCTDTDPIKQLECVRSVPAQVMMDYAYQLYPLFPCIDNVQIVIPPLSPGSDPTITTMAQLFVRGRPGIDWNANIPILMGHNKQEGNLFASAAAYNYGIITPFVLNEAQYVDQLGLNFLHHNTTVTTIRNWYAESEQLNGYWNAIAEEFGGYLINCGTEWITRRAAGYPSSSSHTAASGVAQTNTHVYRYVYSHATEVWLYAFLNATHGSELVYVFGNGTDQLYASVLTPEEVSLSQLIQRYWVRFAASNNPNAANPSPIDPFWPVYDGSIATIMNLDLPVSHAYGPDAINVDQWSRYCPRWMEYFNVRPVDSIDVVSDIWGSASSSDSGASPLLPRLVSWNDTNNATVTVTNALQTPNITQFWNGNITFQSDGCDCPQRFGNLTISLVQQIGLSFAFGNTGGAAETAFMLTGVTTFFDPHTQTVYNQSVGYRYLGFKNVEERCFLWLWSSLGLTLEVQSYADPTIRSCPPTWLSTQQCIAHASSPCNGGYGGDGKTIVSYHWLAQISVEILPSPFPGPQPNPNPTPLPNDNELGPGLVIVIVVSCLAGLAVVGGGTVYCRRRRIDRERAESVRSDTIINEDPESHDSTTTAKPTHTAKNYHLLVS